MCYFPFLLVLLALNSSSFPELSAAEIQVQSWKNSFAASLQVSIL